MIRIPNRWVQYLFEPMWDRYEGSVRLRSFNSLRESQWRSSEEIIVQQSLKLQKIVRHAAETSVFYRERFAKAGVDPRQVTGITDLATLPLLTKSDVRENLGDIISGSFERKDLVKAKTGGSTGVSLQVFCDRRGVEMRAGAALRADEWSGWSLGEPTAAVWGNPRRPVTLKNRIRCWLKDRTIYLDTMRINDEAIDNFLAEWDQVKPGLLYGHAHSIFIFCEALQERGIELRPTGVVATSMMLIEQERKVIEKVCGIRVTNRYGCEEVSLIACECEQHNGMHLNADHNIVEFLKDDGTPCGDGEDGRIVVTELINYGMPMIRYEVGDRGVPSSRTCPCGRGLPLMEYVTGRVADFLVATAGHRVAGISIIENTLTKLPGIRQMQIIQEDSLRLQVNLVRGPEYDYLTKNRLIDLLQEYLGAEVEVFVEEVAHIPQEKSGKYRFTICRI